ncbi:hypothetical protein PV325_011898, partial [Microctonus aethiopoides]
EKGTVTAGETETISRGICTSQAQMSAKIIGQETMLVQLMTQIQQLQEQIKKQRQPHDQQQQPQDQQQQPQDQQQKPQDQEKTSPRTQRRWCIKEIMERQAKKRQI